jgi:hypothetical protein
MPVSASFMERRLSTLGRLSSAITEMEDPSRLEPVSPKNPTTSTISATMTKPR